jgi:hypothetical protein
VHDSIFTHKKKTHRYNWPLSLKHTPHKHRRDELGERRN